MAVALSLVVLGIGVLLTATFLYFALTSLVTTTPITYPEGAHVAAILRLRAGEPLYPEFLSYPLVLTPYPPALYVLGATLSGVLSMGAYETTVAVRALTLATAIGSALTIGHVSRKEGVGLLAALTASALFLSIPLLDHWGFSVRPDLPAIFLSLLAGWQALRGRRCLWIAGVLAGLAMLMKLTAVAMPVSIALWLISQRRFGDGLRFSAATLGTLALGAAVTLVLSSGEAFDHTVVAHMNPLLTVEHAVSVFLQLPRLAWVPFGAALIGLGVQMRTHRLELSGIYWLVALAVGLYSLRGRGGDVNYLIEPAAATCWLGAHGFAAIWNRANRGDLRFLAASALVLIASVAWGNETFRSWRKDGGVDTDRRQPIAEIAAAGSVLTEEPTMALLAGVPLVVSDVFHLSMLQTAGRYDDTDLIQRIRQREYGLVVLRGDVRQTRYINGQPKWPESVRRAIADYYVFSKRVDLYWLYVPDAPRPSRDS